jgi:oxygen-dependent protoporphyrinogen oxidase
VVVGAGVTGLAAAHELSLASDLTFEVVESNSAPGGKVGGGPVGPVDVDTGADGFLVRQPEMTDLCRELGLGDELVSPRTGRAYIWTGGKLRAIPTPSVLGVPIDPGSLADSGIVSSAGMAEHRRLASIEHPPLQGDASIGSVLRPRIGDEVFERLIDPLLGGINAGNSDDISIEAGAATLAEAAREGGVFPDALRARMSSTGGPVFHGVRGGSQRIIDALVRTIGDRLTLGSEVSSIDRRDTAWVLETSTGPRAADAVVLTTPAPTTASLIRGLAPDAAGELAAIELADVVLVTLVYRRDSVGRDLDGSGFLVPRREGLLMTACSWSSSKWAHYDDGRHVILRASAGRTDDRRWMELDEDTLLAGIRDELATTMAVEGEPIAVRVSRWTASLPQYRPGHLDRIAAVEAELEEVVPGLFATGAAFRGLGLPACVRQGRSAARSALDFVDALAPRPQSR